MFKKKDFHNFEFMNIEGVNLTRYLLLIACHILAILLFYPFRIWELHLCLSGLVGCVSLLIWCKFYLNHREYYLKDIETYKKDYPHSHYKIEREDTVALLAWDTNQDLELSFYYFNPLHCCVMIMYSFDITRYEYFILLIINLLLFRFLELWDKRRESDRKIMQKEMHSFYDGKVRVRIFYKKTEKEE